MRVLMLVVSAAVVVASTGAQAASTYKVENWPADADTIPCSSWDHLPDGTWALNGYVKLGSSVVENVGFKGDSTARLLDRKCGKK